MKLKGTHLGKELKALIVSMLFRVCVCVIVFYTVTCQIENPLPDGEMAILVISGK